MLSYNFQRQMVALTQKETPLASRRAQRKVQDEKFRYLWVIMINWEGSWGGVCVCVWRWADKQATEGSTGR